MIPKEICYYCEKEIHKHAMVELKLCLYMVSKIIREKTNLIVDDLDPTRHSKQLVEQTKKDWGL